MTANETALHQRLYGQIIVPVAEQTVARIAAVPTHRGHHITEAFQS